MYPAIDRPHDERHTLEVAGQDRFRWVFLNQLPIKDRPENAVRSGADRFTMLALGGIYGTT